MSDRRTHLSQILWTIPASLWLKPMHPLLLKLIKIHMDRMCKSKIEPKLMFIFWLLWLVRILHKALLVLRKISPDSLCPWCKHPFENFVHVIRDCPFSASVWNSSVTQIPRKCLFQEWVRVKMEADFQIRGIDWVHLFPYICHEIRKDQNICSFYHGKPAVPKLYFS